MSDPVKYTVGWICAKQCEFVAAVNFIDELHEEPEFLPPQDHNGYQLGRIGKHNVVITLFPEGEMGKAIAASVANNMLRSFPNIKICLMVGIGGGVPTRADIRLGDVVVSVPRKGHSGVLQYDFGHTLQDQPFRCDGFLNQPPDILRSAVAKLSTLYECSGHNLEGNIESIVKKKPRLARKYARPDTDGDRLFASDYIHGTGSQPGMHSPENEQCAALCDPAHLIMRSERPEWDNIMIHYGLIASADQRMKDAILRDKYANEMNVLCFEMETAGLMNRFPCLAIRGISDYSDSHKNDSWQGYASMTAAAYAKDLLLQIRPGSVEAQTKIPEIAGILSTITDDLKAVHIDTHDTHESVKNIELEREQEKIKNWLSPPDPSINYNTALEKHHPGSGRWFLEGDKYFKWKTQKYSNSILWINGGTGSGKTILSSAVIRNLEQDSSCRPVLYFYFSFQEFDKQAAQNMTRSLITQLSYRQLETSQHLTDLYLSCEGGRRQPTYKQLCNTFFRMAEQAKEIWLVLDAINECMKGTKELLTWIKNLLSVQSHVHIYMTSQPGTDIGLELATFVPEEGTVSLHNSFVVDDIRTFIEASVEKNEGFSRWRGYPKVQEEIGTEVSKRADVMFRWAALQLDSLEECTDLHSLRHTLASLPADLNETYERIINAIPKGKRLNATKILQFLTYSERPLTIKEAVDALAVQIEGGGDLEFNADFRMPHPREILCLCPGLIVAVSPKENLTTGNDENKLLQLAHFSVKEYLISTALSENQLDVIFQQKFREIEAKTTIATICLVYLLHLNIKLPRDQLAQMFPLVHYCSRYWTSATILALANSKNETLRSLTKRLFSENQNSYQNCYNFFLPDRPWASDLEIQQVELPPPLYYASFCGLVEVAECLIDKGADVNARGGYYGNALCAALENDQYAIFDLLLRKDANVNAEYEDQESPLCIASRNGQARAVELLLAKGAQVNAQNENYGSALCAAAIHGHTEIVEKLLNEGAEVNTPLEHYGSALCAASCNGYYKVAQLLLRHGADVNFEGGDYGNALSAALENDQYAIAELLLDSGFLEEDKMSLMDDFEFIDAEGTTVGQQTRHLHLNSPSSQGIDLTYEEYGYELFAASNSGDRGAVESLWLKIKFDLSLQILDDYHSAALRTAVESNYDDVVKLFLDKGFQCRLSDQDYLSLLSKQFNRNSNETVKMLINFCDVFCLEPRLSIAIQKSKDRFTEILLRFLEPTILDSHDPQADQNLYNLFSILWERGQFTLVRDMLASLGYKKSWIAPLLYQDMLLSAVLSGNVSIILLLMQLGVEIEIISDGFDNLLKILKLGDYHIIKQLTKQGDSFGINEELARGIKKYHKVLASLLQPKALQDLDFDSSKKVEYFQLIRSLTGTKAESQFIEFLLCIGSKINMGLGQFNEDLDEYHELLVKLRKAGNDDIFNSLSDKAIASRLAQVGGF